MWLVTVRDLQYRALRFGVSIIGTAVLLAMVFLMTGLSAQLVKEPSDTVAALGADGWVVREGVSGPFTVGSTLPENVYRELELGSGSRAAPVLIARQTYRVAGGPPRDVTIVGHDGSGLGSPRVAEGRAIAGAREIVADAVAGLEVGASVPIGDIDYEIVGESRNLTLFAGMPLVFMSLRDAQVLVAQGEPIASAILVDGTVRTMPRGLKVLTVEEVAADALRPVEKSTGAIDMVRVLLWLVAAIIIGAVIYLAALERQRDFAVMKAMGSSTWSLLAGLLAQSVLIALVAAILASGLQILLVPFFPLPVVVPRTTFLTLPLLAVGVAVVASLGALRQAVKVEPALAFAGKG